MTTQQDVLVNSLFDTNYGRNIYFSNDPHANLKRYNLLIIANMVKNKNLKGSICEFGIYYGYTFTLLIGLFGKQYKYCGYDSFQGLCQPSEYDNLTYDGCIKGNMTVAENKVSEHLNKVINNVSDYDINFYKGWVNDTIPDNLPSLISFAHVDVDLFEPTIHILSNIIPRMEKGGVVIIDDYMDNNWKGIESATKYIEEKFDVKVHPLNLEVKPSHKYPAYQGYIIF
jgi:hypothetical protein